MKKITTAEVMRAFRENPSAEPEGGEYHLLPAYHKRRGYRRLCPGRCRDFYGLRRFERLP